MPLHIGVGSSENTDSRQAGREAAQSALQHGNLSSCDLLLLFSTSKHDPHALHAGVREVIGSTARIVGGYSVGIITNDALGYDGYQVGAAAIQNAGSIRTFFTPDVTQGEAAAGRALAEQIAAQCLPQSGNAEEAGAASLLLFYDWVNRTQGRLKLNMATPLLEGMREHLPSSMHLAGAGLVGDMQCRETWQWFDDQVTQHAAMALSVGGELRIDSVVMHGCRPDGGYHTVTAADGAVILEIDNRPAVDVMAEMLGLESIEQWDDYRFYVTLGINKGDPWGDFCADDYANRLCLGVDKKRGGLIMFETGVTAGMDVQMMRRSVDYDYISERTSSLLAQLESEGRRPAMAFYIDCAGRAAAYCGSDTEDAAEVQAALGKIPLLGIYSGIEVGRVADDWQPLEWSGVLCVLSEPQ
jgi:hypothetical protein